MMISQVFPFYLETLGFRCVNKVIQYNIFSMVTVNKEEVVLCSMPLLNDWGINATITHTHLCCPTPIITVCAKCINFYRALCHSVTYVKLNSRHYLSVI